MFQILMPVGFMSTSQQQPCAVPQWVLESLIDTDAAVAPSNATVLANATTQMTSASNIIQGKSAASSDIQTHYDQQRWLRELVEYSRYGADKWSIQLKLCLSGNLEALTRAETEWQSRWPHDPLPDSPIPTAADWWRFLWQDLRLAHISAIRALGADRMTKDREWVLTRPESMRAALLNDIEATEASMTNGYELQMKGIRRYHPLLLPPPYHNPVTRQAVQQSLRDKLRILEEIRVDVSKDLSNIQVPGFPFNVIQLIDVRIEQIRREWKRAFPDDASLLSLSSTSPTWSDLQWFVAQIHVKYKEHQDAVMNRDQALSQIELSDGIARSSGTLLLEKKIATIEQEVAKLAVERPNIVAAAIISCTWCACPAKKVFGICEERYPSLTKEGRPFSTPDAFTMRRLQSISTPWVAACAEHARVFEFQPIFAKHPDRRSAIQILQASRKRKAAPNGEGSAESTAEVGVQLPLSLMHENQFRAFQQEYTNSRSSRFPRQVCEICFLPESDSIKLMAIVPMEVPWKPLSQTTRFYSSVDLMHVCKQHALTLPEWMKERSNAPIVCNKGEISCTPEFLLNWCSGISASNQATPVPNTHYNFQQGSGWQVYDSGAAAASQKFQMSTSSGDPSSSASSTAITPYSDAISSEILLQHLLPIFADPPFEPVPRLPQVEISSKLEETPGPSNCAMIIDTDSAAQVGQQLKPITVPIAVTNSIQVIPASDRALASSFSLKPVTPDNRNASVATPPAAAIATLSPSMSLSVDTGSSASLASAPSSSSSSSPAVSKQTPTSASKPPSVDSKGQLHGRVSAWEVQVMRITTGGRIEAFEVSSHFFMDRDRALAYAHGKARSIYEQELEDKRDNGEDEGLEFEESEDGCYNFPDSSYDLPALAVTLKPTSINFDAADGVILQTSAEEST